MPEVRRVLPLGVLSDQGRFECPSDSQLCRALEQKVTDQGKLVDVTNGGLGLMALLLEGQRVSVVSYGMSSPPAPFPPELQGHALAISGGAAQGGVCVLLDTGAVWCNGRKPGSAGFRPHPDPTEFHWEPVLLDPRGRRVAQISGGMDLGCALFDTGQLQCWGGEFTRGVTRDAPLGARNVKSVSVSGAHICALFDGGGVACWGEGSHGELGYAGEAKNRCRDAMSDDLHGFGMTYYCNWTPPTGNLPLPAAATQVFTGQLASCALLQDGELWCWGDLRGLVLAGGEPNSSDGWAKRRSEGRDTQGVPIRKRGEAITLPSHPVALPVACEITAFSVQSRCALCADGCLQCLGNAGLAPNASARIDLGQYAVATCREQVR